MSTAGTDETKVRELAVGQPYVKGGFPGLPSRQVVPAPRYYPLLEEHSASVPGKLMSYALGQYPSPTGYHHSHHPGSRDLPHYIHGPWALVPRCGIRYLRSIRITFCSSPCFTDRYSCRGWKRSFFRLSGDGGGEGVLLRFKYRQQRLHPWPSRTLKTAQTHLSDSWMTKAFSRASRPGPGGRPTAERQPPLGRVSEGPELSMVSARGSQGGRLGSPCPRIRALWKKVLRSGAREIKMGNRLVVVGRGQYLGWEVSARPGASCARGGGAGAAVPTGGVPPSPRGMVTS